MHQKNLRFATNNITLSETGIRQHTTLNLTKNNIIQEDEYQNGTCAGGQMVICFIIRQLGLMLSVTRQRKTTILVERLITLEKVQVVLHVLDKRIW
jgi:hypothetical protein